MASSCPHPLLDESLFASTGGSVLSRWCESLDGVSCCLPCPHAYWRWEHVIYLVNDVRLGVWPSIPVLISLVWLLVTYIIFPTHLTDRHYLNVAPTIGFVCISIAFIIPSRGHQRECYNEITPNDMRSDALSGLMGVVLFLGAWLVITSVFFRSLALHLTVFWELKLGRIYRNIALACIFIGSAALVAILLTISGIQYTFGQISYIIPNHDRAAFWGPLLAISASSLGLQVLTIVYCIVLVLRPWWNVQLQRLWGYTPSADVERVLGVQQTATRIRNIMKLQWRNSLITVTVLVYVCFLASVFMRLRQFHAYPESDRRAWFDCLASSNGDKSACLSLAGPLGPSEPELIAVLFLLVMSGTLALALFFRRSMIRGWISLMKGEPIPINRSFESRYGPSQRGEEFGVEFSDRASSARLSQFPGSDGTSLVMSGKASFQVT